MRLYHLPSQPGTYALLLRLNRATQLRIGARGPFDLPRGWYIYVGRARGAGGLRARVMRHWRGATRLHWHIDYLRRVAQPVRVWLWADPQADECAWARALELTPTARVIVPRFGASDCDCAAHLWFVARRAEVERLFCHLPTFG